MAADSRTTILKNGNTRYKDDCNKIFSFPHDILLGHCGEGMLDANLYVEDFLTEFKAKCPENISIEQFPVRLLNELAQKGYKTETLYIAAGLSDENKRQGSVYLINGKDMTITLKFVGTQYGACCFGEDAIADEIINGIDYETLSVREARDLAKLTVDATIKAMLFKNPQTVGGVCACYSVWSKP